VTNGTQKQKLNAAIAAYILPLNKSDYTVYLAGPGGLDNLWPSDSHLGAKSAELLDYQVYNAKKDTLPAFLFRVRNTTRRDACQRIGLQLRAVSEGLPVYLLDGGTPDPVMTSK
jgi:hypothetical protein